MFLRQSAIFGFDGCRWSANFDTNIFEFGFKLLLEGFISRVLNSVLLSRELDTELHYTDIADAAHCSNEYARRTVNEIQDGEITDEDLETAVNDTLQDALLHYYRDHDIISSSGAEETAGASETVEIDLTADDPFEKTTVSKRDALANIYLFDSDIHYTDAADIAGCSTEYARQTFNSFQDNERDPEAYRHQGVQLALADARERGELDEFLDTTAKPEQASEVDSDAEEADAEVSDVSEPTPATGTTETAEAPDAVVSSEEAEEAMIPASELKPIREAADVLYRQAEYESDDSPKDRRAMFVAKELRNRLDEVLEKHTTETQLS